MFCISLLFYLVYMNYVFMYLLGIDSVELSPTSQKLLILYLELYINYYRAQLMEHWWDNKQKQNLMITETHKTDQQYLFVPFGKTKEQLFTESGWSSYVCAIFKEKTGMILSKSQKHCHPYS